MLPPVCPSTPPRTSVGAAFHDNNNDNNNSDAVEPAASPVQKPRVEPLVVNHVRFSYAFKKNDAAKIMPFLSKDVTLQTLDGAHLQGLSAVLAHLVGPRMAKLSSHMHIKGAPTRAGLAQTKFVYEHGILFRDPLFVETIDWTPDLAIAAITHVAVPDGKNSKAHFHDSNKIPSPLSSSTGSAVSSTASTLDNNQLDEDEPEHAHLDDSALMDSSIRKSKSLGEPFSQSFSRASSGDESTRFSSSSSVSGDEVILKIQQIACTNLDPFRTRKHVNPFVTIRKCPNGGSQWKSSVARHDRNPKWANVPIELHAQHHRENDVLEISLWDFHLFKTVKVATAALVVADLFAQEEDDFTTSVQLERMELTDTAPPIQLTMRFAQKNPSRHHSASSHGRSSQVGDLDVTTDAARASMSSAARRASCCQQLMEVKVGRLSDLRWYLQDAVLAGRGGSSMLLRAAFVLVLVWLISQIDFDKRASRG